MSCFTLMCHCNIFTPLIIFPMTHIDGVIQVRLRQAISWHHMRARTHTHTNLKPFPLPLSLKSSYSTSSYPFLSHTCSFSLILSNHLILNCYHIWFNYATSPLNLFSLTLSLSHHSSFLFHSLVLLKIWSTVSPSFFSLPIWRFTSPMRPPLLPCHTRHCFLCCYCLPHPLCFSFSLSDLLWECYLYSNIPRRVEQSRTEQWREFDFPKWASPQKHNKTLLSFTQSMLTPLCLFITSKCCSSYCVVHKILEVKASSSAGKMELYLWKRGWNQIYCINVNKPHSVVIKRMPC